MIAGALAFFATTKGLFALASGVCLFLVRFLRLLSPAHLIATGRAVIADIEAALRFARWARSEIVWAVGFARTEVKLARSLGAKLWAFLVNVAEIGALIFELAHHTLDNALGWLLPSDSARGATSTYDRIKSLFVAMLAYFTASGTLAGLVGTLDATAHASHSRLMAVLAAVAAFLYDLLQKRVNTAARATGPADPAA